MNENAKKWVAALRSGEYKQGQYNLRSDQDHFYCLGVACDLYDSNKMGTHGNRGYWVCWIFI